MKFAVYIPDTIALSDYTTDSTTYPYLMYLSGLTCSDENVCQKSGVFNHLSKHKVCMFMYI